MALAVIVAGACTPEPPPRKVSHFLDDPIALEATLSRCNANRSRSRNDVECRNAREAAKRISTAEEEERQRVLEEESRRKLEAIRRRNEARDQRRREAEEAARRREELLYEQQFAPVEGGDQTDTGSTLDSEPATQPEETYREEIEPQSEPSPVDESQPDAGGDQPSNDLESLRQELERRNQTGDDSGSN